MLLNLYGADGLVFQVLATGFKEAHLQDKIKFDVVEADKVGQKFRDAVKKDYSAKYLDDSDMIIRFAEVKSEPPAEDEPADDETSEKPEEQSDIGKEETGDEAAGETADEDNKDEKKEVSEAEVSATGTELKKKIVDTVARCLFQDDKNKIELVDLIDYMDGYNVSFIKVQLKAEETKTQDTAEK